MKKTNTKKMKCRYIPVVLFAATVLLSGCGLYSRYSRPELAGVADSLFRPGVSGSDTACLGAMPWRELFTDARLQALIERGLERNVDLAVARLQVTEAQAVLANARLMYYPTVGLAPQAGVSHYDGQTKKTYSLGATASWEADIFGRQTNARRGADAALGQAEAYGQAVRTQLIATVAETYYALLTLDSQQAIMRETAANWEATVATLEALAAAGRANEVAVRQARASHAALEASLESVGQTIAETENALSLLLREPSHSIPRGSLAAQRFPDTLSAGVPLRLLDARPDVRQAEAALAQSFYATNAARAAFYPSLTLSGTLGWTNNGGGAILNPGRWLSSAIAQLTAPLFNRGINRANLTVARARQEEASLRFGQTLLEAGAEVNDALAEWQTAVRRIALDERQIADLEAAVEKTVLLVRHSPSSYLEVLTAQQALLNARLTLVQDRAARIRGVIHLYHALGGGRG